MTSPNTNHSRRVFLSWGVTLATAAGALSLSLLNFMRMPFPIVTPEKPKRFKIGSPKDFTADSVKYFKKQRAYVFKDKDGFYCISVVCPHLGCTVLKETARYSCPCHGSKFDLSGRVTNGPAPKGLTWFKIERDQTGLLYVDMSKTVARGSKFII